jgi:acetyl-CoA carboxylase carboxyltransferase component
LLGAAWSWMDYGRLDIGFMYSWVLGSAALMGFAAAVIALVRNWIARNPMA